MDFKNQNLSLEDLPQYQYTDKHYVNQNYKRLLRLQLGFFIIPFVIAVGILIWFQADIPKLAWLIPSLVLSVVILFWLTEIELGFKERTYGMREHDIYFSKGFFVHKETVLPFNRIQHVEVKQGIMLRWFKLYSVKLYTAGASSGDLSIYGLKQETASKIKAYVMNQNSLNSNEDDQV